MRLVVNASSKASLDRFVERSKSIVEFCYFDD